MRSKIVDKLILPYFVIEGKKKVSPIVSMPGISRFSVDMLLRDFSKAYALGIRMIILFGVPSPRTKDARGTYSACLEGIIPQAIRAIKSRFKDIVVMTDICVCAYTDHGHCGVLDKECGVGVFIDRDQTLEMLVGMALAHARSGADWVAPSAMAEGQVVAIRRALDRAGYQKVKILGYSAKYASAFYGPFRDAASSAPSFGDRRSYQIDPEDTQRALRKIKEDIKGGADMVMVKPALAYLDVIRQVRDRIKVPLVAYNVSGEYAMVKAGVTAGYWKERPIVEEIMTAILRAGADIIITYHAVQLAQWEKRQ